MGGLHPVTASVRNALALLVVHRSSCTERDKMVVFIPCYWRASLSLALIKKQPEKGIVTSFSYIYDCWFPTINGFPFPCCFCAILQLVFPTFCFWASEANSLFWDAFLFLLLRVAWCSTVLEVTFCGPVMLLGLGRAVLWRTSSRPKLIAACQQREAARHPAVMLTCFY